MFICLSLFSSVAGAPNVMILAVGQICIILATLVQPELITFTQQGVHVLMSIPHRYNLVLPNKGMTSSFGSLVQRTEISKPSHDAPNPSLAKPLPKPIIAIGAPATVRRGEFERCPN
jgi:hypothetical protein